MYGNTESSYNPTSSSKAFSNIDLSFTHRKGSFTTQRALNTMRELNDSVVSINDLRNIHCQNFTALLNNPQVLIKL